MREERDGRVIVETVAEQDGNQIVRNAEAELELSGSGALVRSPPAQARFLQLTPC